MFRSLKGAARALMILTVGVALSACAGRSLSDAERAQNVVSGANAAFQDFWASTDSPMKDFQNLFPKAKGIVIFPGLVKGGLLFAAEAGNGILLAKGADGTWGDPAFYLLAGGSFGLQAGGQASDVILLVFNDAAVDALINHQGKLGADLGISVGTVGTGLEAATTFNAGADILAFTRAVGMYAGGSLEASALIKRKDFNGAYYGGDYTPRQIVVERAAPMNPGADNLKASLNAKSTPAASPIQSQQL